MRILLAPDKFKGALAAPAVASAIAAGIRDVYPAAEIDLCPMGDGGDGTAELLAARGGYEERRAEVLDALGRPIVARWWANPPARAAIVELAEASGLARLRLDERDPLTTTTFGTGQLLRAALDAGNTALTLGVGGSATVDGGAGCLQALDCEIRDTAGKVMREPLTGGQLGRIGGARRIGHEHFGLRVLCDVDNPLLGPRGAAAVFGPQKGASPAGVSVLEAGLSHWADVLAGSTGRDVRELPHGGAAGGVAAGLNGVYGAPLVPGAMAVAWDVGLFDRLADCDLCITGEGRLDATTASGKVVAVVAQLAAAQGVPTIALVGAAENLISAADFGIASVHVITPVGCPLDRALQETAKNLRSAAPEAISAWQRTDGDGGRDV